jgi:DNA polymerase-3 subunit alpha
MGDKSKGATASVQSALKPSDFVHLHNHTHHSLLDGLTKVDELVAKTKELGMESVAITDHGTLSGAIELYSACRKQNIKPIIGIETYVAARTIHDRDPAKDKARYHLILLAMDNKGYENLMRLSTIANLEGVYYKPRIDHDLLQKYNEGIIALSGCAGGEVGENLRSGNYDEAKRIAGWYKSIFGDRYYLELQDHGHPKAPDHWDEQGKINRGLLKLSKDLGIPAVVTCDAHYLNRSDQEAHEILLCVQTGSFLSDQDRMSLKQFELHVTEPQELISRWGEDNPELLTNTKAIADRCDVNIELGKILIPKFPVPQKETEKSYLHKLVWRGLAWRYGGKTEDEVSELSEVAARKTLEPEIIKRAEYELGVIDDMGFNGYFLIVSDFIGWGKDQGVVFGPGRGSAAGSIVSYAIKITEVDPIKHDLMFERFLNPHRISMPDIDVDIQDTRRDEVIQYCVEKYGKDRVANIVTFGTMAARAAIRDVARVLQVPYGEADRIAKLIPPPVQGRHVPLKVSIEKDPDLRSEYANNQTAKQVIDFAIRLEGTIRSHGVHAAGVVIAPDDIVKFVPLEMAQKGVVSTQYPMNPVEELGLLKMDFLGLSNLTIIKNTLRIIRKVHKKEIELTDIPYDDTKTFELLRRADTTGVFQIESAGMKRYLKELKPTLFEDIVAMVALYRPGPMAEIPRFIQGKNDASSITYLHESLEPILKDTYGVMVYQEQIIVLLQLIAGYSAGQADLVRKAIGKKKRDIMAAEEPKFIEGCKKQGLTEQQAKKLWEQIQPFADYSFNKAHATCYAMIAYWTAYLKANYPDAFMAALMTSDQDDTERLAIEISECQHMGISVLPPDINQSFVEFSVVPGENTIRFGMAAVKGVGTGAVEEILRAREEGKFTSVEDFAKRVSTKFVNRKAWESLIKAGGFDAFGDRSDLLFNLDNILAFASKLQKDVANGQSDLFGGLDIAVALPTIKLETAPAKHPERERLLWERDLLGLYLSAHPLDKYDTYFAEQTVPLMSLKPEYDGRTATFGGVITTARQIVTKSGTKMAFVAIEDKTGEGEVIVFPSTFAEVGEGLVQDAVIRATGRVSARDREGKLSDDAKLIAESVQIVSQDELDNYTPLGAPMAEPKISKPKKNANKQAAAANAKPKEKIIYEPIDDIRVQPAKIFVHVKNPDDHEKLLSLKQSFNKHPGDSEIVLVLGQDKKSAVRLPFTASITDELKQHIASLYGEECVAIK